MNLKKFENLHIAIWLVKDTCWCLGLRYLAVLMIVPTLSVALHIVWHSRNDKADFYHNIAVALWIVANSVWMVGELFFDDTLRPYALIFFCSGLLVVGWYYFISSRQSKIDA
ncbi:MAG: hypothetical protein U0T84_10220 [Chitinophagales bacterium]